MLQTTITAVNAAALSANMDEKKPSESRSPAAPAGSGADGLSSSSHLGEPPVSPSNELEDDVAVNGTIRYSPQFWAAFIAVVLASMLSTMDSIVLSTALPTIATVLQLGPSYVWAINIFALTRFVKHPNHQPLPSRLHPIQVK